MDSSNLLRFPTGRNSSQTVVGISPNGTASFSPFWEIGLVVRGPHDGVVVSSQGC